MRVQPPQQQFVPLSDDEIERLIAQGMGHLLQPYRVGSSCLPRCAGSDPLPRPDWPQVA